MAFVLACLKCGARLRSATQLRAGRRLTCPTCRATFTLHADAEPEARRGRAESIPDALLLDDEVDDDRLPVGRTRRRDEDDDRPPVGRRRRDPEARPGRRRRPVSPPVLLGVGIGLFFILLAGGTGAYFLFRKTSAPAASDLIAYAPENAVGLAGFDFDILNADEGLRQAIERRPPSDLAELDRAGLRTADLSRALVARTPNGVAAAVRFKAPEDRARYLQANVVGKSYAPFIGTGSFHFGYFADPRTLVMADTEATIQNIYDGGGKPRAPIKLQLLADKPRGPMWQATGKTSPFERPRFGFGDEGMVFRTGPTVGSVAWLEPAGGLFDVRYEIEFEQRGQAVVGAATLKGLFMGRREFGGVFNQRVPPEDQADVRRGYEGATVTDDGQTVSARLRVPPTEAVRAVDALRP